MIDYGLLASIVLAFGVPAILARRWAIASFDRPVGFLDAALGPATLGLVVGRFAALAWDDPAGFRRVADVLVIRSGVEFWPGVAAAAGLILWSARKDRAAPVVRLAAMVPLGMVGYASYEAACIVRDGCYGPVSSIGLRPAGLSTAMVPIGILMALATVAAAAGLHRLRSQGADAVTTLLLATLSVAGIRAVASFWLPRVGDALTRQHRTSLAITLVATLALGVLATVRTRPIVAGQRR